MEYRVSSRVWTLLMVEGAPHVTGTTSSLRTATVAPERITMVEYPSGTVTAKVEGPQVKINGEPGLSWAKVTVLVTQMDGSHMRYEPAPQWLSEVYQRLSA